MDATKLRYGIFGLGLVIGVACTEFEINWQHCWYDRGDETCEERFGAGYICSRDLDGCPGHEQPYGCVPKQSMDAECYSPTGQQQSCADPKNTAEECSEGFGGTAGDGDGDMDPVCGDGILEGSEECDDGNMDDTDSCTSVCVVAVCGDGIVQEGVEGCDDGNQDDTDECVSCSTAYCGDSSVHATLEECDDGNKFNTDECLNSCVAASCLDGFVQVDVEECDDGNMSNTDGCTNVCALPACGDGFVQMGEECDGDDELNVCDGCTWKTRFVFVTSISYDGNLGGLTGADEKCNQHAQAANLPGTYKAWLSNLSDGPPSTRFVQSAVPYVLVNKDVVADSWADLTDGQLHHGINRTELNMTTTDTDGECDNSVRLVRTGTASDGTMEADNCDGFTSNAMGDLGTVGRSWHQQTWTLCGPVACNLELPIYCFQQ